MLDIPFPLKSTCEFFAFMLELHPVRTGTRARVAHGSYCVSLSVCARKAEVYAEVPLLYAISATVCCMYFVRGRDALHKGAAAP